MYASPLAGGALPLRCLGSGWQIVAVSQMAQGQSTATRALSEADAVFVDRAMTSLNPAAELLDPQAGLAAAANGGR